MQHVTHDPIHLEDLMAAVRDPRCGGVASFVGMVRRGGADGAVLHIEYSAYDEMLEREWARILGQAKTEWPNVRLAAQHRLGTVPVGETSIAVVAAAPHRADAFAACRHVIEQAKVRLPVWKREVREDGSATWRDNAGNQVPSRPPGAGATGA